MAGTPVMPVWGPGIDRMPDDGNWPSGNGRGVNNCMLTFIDTYFTIRLFADSFI